MEIETFLFIPQPPKRLVDREQKLKLLKRLLFIMSHPEENYFEDRTLLVWGLENLITDVEMEAH